MSHKLLVLLIRTMGYLCVFGVFIAGLMTVYLVHGLLVEPIIQDAQLEQEIKRESAFMELRGKCHDDFS